MQQPIEQLARFNYLLSEINAAYHEAARRLDLSDSALMVLYAACCAGGHCSLGDICRLSGASKQTIHSAVHGLEAKGVVCLENRDGKRKTVCLTKAGTDLAGRTVGRLIAAENEIYGSWPQEDWEAYIALTQRYLTDFREKLGAL